MNAYCGQLPKSLLDFDWAFHIHHDPETKFNEIGVIYTDNVSTGVGRFIVDLKITPEVEINNNNIFFLGDLYGGRVSLPRERFKGFIVHESAQLTQVEKETVASRFVKEYFEVAGVAAPTNLLSQTYYFNMFGAKVTPFQI